MENRVSSTNRRQPVSSRSNPSSLPLEAAVWGLLRWRKYLVFCTLLALAAGVGLASRLQSKKYTYEGALLYTPNEITTPYYRPPLLGNLLHIVDSPPVLSKLQKEFELPDSLSDLRRNVTCELVSSGDTLVVQVVRKDPAQAEKLLNRMMELIVDETRRISKKSLQDFVKEFESNLVQAKQMVDTARQNLQDFLDEQGLQNADTLEDQATALQSSVYEIDLELEMARIDLTSSRSKRERLLRVEPQETTTEPTQLPIGNFPPMASDNDRRMFLKDQIAQEQQTSSYAVKLQVKQRERDRAVKLHEKGLISDAEMDRIEGELSILRAEQTARVSQLQEQLSLIEQKLSKRMSDKAPLLVDGQVSLAGFADQPQLREQSIALLELDILGAEHKTDGLSRKLDAKQRELEQTARLLKKSRPLVEAVRIAQEDQLRVEQLAEEFRHTYKSDVNDLKIVQAATPAIDGIRSNSSKLLAAGAIGTLGLLLAPLFLLELRKQTVPTPENTTRALGIPLLSVSAENRGRDEAAAMLALRVRRNLPNKHSAILFVCGDEHQPDLATPRSVARSIALGGESVVLVELDSDLPSTTPKKKVARPVPQPTKVAVHVGDLIHEQSQGTFSTDESRQIGELDSSSEPSYGVTDYLEGRITEIDLVARPTEQLDYHCLHRGTIPLSADLLSRGGLGELIDRLKADHSLVIVSGVSLSQRLQQEYLSDHVEGIILCCPPGPMNKASLTATKELTQFGLPVYGMIV
jgi:hypothetical protein